MIAFSLVRALADSGKSRDVKVDPLAFQADNSRAVGATIEGIEAAGKVIVLVSSATGVPKSGPSLLRFFQKTKRRHIIIVRPIPPSMKNTTVSVEKNSVGVPVMASEALFDDEDNEDALAGFSPSLPRILLSASLTRKLFSNSLSGMSLRGDVDSDGIVALD